MAHLASDTVMVMAAGLGKRMRPLTATRPKPLVQVRGKPLINYCLDHAEQAGLERAVVNVHYLPDALEAHLKAYMRKSALQIHVSDERQQLLETGGGLVKAATLIDRDQFFCVNSDNIWLDGPQSTFQLLSQQWDNACMDALLLLVPHQRAFNHKGSGDFHMSSSGHLIRRKSGYVAPFIFTGIQLLSRRLLEDAPTGPFSTNLLWNRAIESNRLCGAVHQGLWYDVGSPAAIPPTEAALRDA